ncbi:hypothetical protein LPB19_03550 [Marinobacter salinisoli]|uniref:Rap1a immunity protein domain-containing protein n=1 Tax=Marinobacter salinisoli TaxID=2769486 RepID=A0ABX7MT12_9GAMM|nr:Rap1a/Tai family immunity protein [Marinobacter salinisoli]QSP95505.1 hypothetical protein LPB19_03550 [Marinobacter salinisoli]
MYKLFSPIIAVALAATSPVALAEYFTSNHLLGACQNTLDVFSGKSPSGPQNYSPQYCVGVIDSVVNTNVLSVMTGNKPLMCVPDVDRATKIGHVVRYLRKNGPTSDPVTAVVFALSEAYPCKRG